MSEQDSLDPGESVVDGGMRAAFGRSPSQPSAEVERPTARGITISIETPPAVRYRDEARVGSVTSSEGVGRLSFGMATRGPNHHATRRPYRWCLIANSGALHNKILWLGRDEPQPVAKWHRIAASKSAPWR